MKRYAPLIAGLALLAGCSGQPGAGSPPPAESPTSAASSTTPSPSPTYATENQVASVISGIESSVREVSEGAFDCRLLSVTAPPEGTVDHINLQTCYTDELTVGLQAQKADRDLGQLSPPPSMTALVNDTRIALQAVYNVDLEGACGPPLSVPADTSECKTALGSRVTAYTSLVSQLDKWGPYL